MESVKYCPKCASERIAYTGLAVFVCQDCGTRWELLHPAPEMNPD